MELEVQALAGTTRVHALLQDPMGNSFNRVELALQNGKWNATVSDLSLSDTYRLTVVGSDESNREIVSNSVDSIRASQAGATWVHLSLASPKPNSEGGDPVVDALLASAQRVEPGQAVDLRVVGRDREAGGDLAYHWVATCGRLSGDGAAMVTWFAPDEDEDCQVTVGLANRRGGMAEARMNLTVRKARGSVRVVVIINALPVVARMLASPTVVEKGIGIDLSAVANDQDGDRLSYRWSSSCPGVFSAENEAKARFLPAEIPSNDCRFTIAVDDGHGGRNTGMVVLSGKKPVVNVAPAMGLAFQTGQQVLPGSVVLLHVEARDPEGQALTWTWSASKGAVGNQVDGVGTSEVTFVAPADMEVDCVITATASDESGAQSSHVFHVLT